MKTIFKLEERVDVYKNGEVIYSDTVDRGYYSCRRNAFAAIKPYINKYGDSYLCQANAISNLNKQVEIHNKAIQ